MESPDPGSQEETSLSHFLNWWIVSSNPDPLTASQLTPSSACIASIVRLVYASGVAGTDTTCKYHLLTSNADFFNLQCFSQ